MSVITARKRKERYETLTKAKFISIISTAVLATASSGVFADETTPVSDGSTSPTVSVTAPVPTDKSTDKAPDTSTSHVSDGTSGVTAPTTVTPAPPTTPKTEENPTTPIEPATPTTTDQLPASSDEAGTNVNPNIPNQPDQDKGNTSSQDGTSSERPQTTDQANQQGASQVGTTSNVAGQVVQNVTAEAPVETATGVSIVSTKEGKVVLSDGSEVSPETVGARTNEDKTITVTKKDGSKVTLPHTGDAKTLGLSFLGTLMAFTGTLIWKQKKVQDN